MKILCLEQGDWIKSSEFPSNGRDWEARRYTDFDISASVFGIFARPNGENSLFFPCYQGIGGIQRRVRVAGCILRMGSGEL
jgi:hypothetical protein